MLYSVIREGLKIFCVSSLQNFNPVLFEFGMLVGGVLGTTVDKSDMRIGPFGYIDPFFAYYGPGMKLSSLLLFASNILLLMK